MLLYLHIPFCNSKCGYCAFNSTTAPHTLHQPYFNAMIQQLKTFLTYNSPSFESVFIGGGTPSIVAPDLYKPLFDLFLPHLKPHSEISIEANPNHLTQHFASILKTMGANRISLGAQSFNPAKLQWLERDHHPSNVFTSVEVLHNLGWKNINIDLIYNTPFDNEKNLIFEIQQVQKLPITHLCAYSLMIEEGSRFFKKGKKEIRGQEEMHTLIEAIGFKQYEVSNYAKTAHYCKHNIGYWQHKHYLGIGAGAVSFMRNQRYTNTKNITEYIKNPFLQEKETLSANDLTLEKLFLGLRSHQAGIQPSLIPHQENFKTALQEKIVFEKNDKIYASNLFLADEIALFLSQD